MHMHLVDNWGDCLFQVLKFGVTIDVTDPMTHLCIQDFPVSSSLSVLILIHLDVCIQIIRGLQCFVGQCQSVHVFVFSFIVACQ